MLVGLQDDPSFRWLRPRHEPRPGAAGACRIVRTTVYWSRIAPTRPADAANPFDPAYRFDDLDDLVRSAPLRGMDVMMSIWGTPTWANGGKGPNYAPTSSQTCRNFIQALAAATPAASGLSRSSASSRSGTSRTSSSSSPRSTTAAASRSRPRSTPGSPARLRGDQGREPACAGRASARRPRAAATAARHRTACSRRCRRAASQSCSPSRSRGSSSTPGHTTRTPTTRAEADPEGALPERQRSSAVPTSKTTSTSGSSGRSRRSGSPSTGSRRSPANPRGVTTATAGRLPAQARDYAAGDPNVPMFIWFIFRDDPVSLWHSGLLDESAARKPGYAAFTAAAKPFDVRSPLVSVRQGRRTRPSASPSGSSTRGTARGEPRSHDLRRLPRSGSASASRRPRSASTGYASFKVPITKAKLNGVYRVFMKIGDVNGNSVIRTATVTVK